MKLACTWKLKASWLWLLGNWKTPIGALYAITIPLCCQRQLTKQCTNGNIVLVNFVFETIFEVLLIKGSGSSSSDSRNFDRSVNVVFDGIKPWRSMKSHSFSFEGILIAEEPLHTCWHTSSMKQWSGSWIIWMRKP